MAEEDSGKPAEAEPTFSERPPGTRPSTQSRGARYARPPGGASAPTLDGRKIGRKPTPQPPSGWSLVVCALMRAGAMGAVGCLGTPPFPFLINLDQQIVQNVSWRIEALVGH